MSKKTTIGIDLGGTRIKALAIDAEGKILHQFYQATDDGDEAIWKQSVFTAVERLQKETGCSDAAIGISAPGLPGPDHQTIACMPGRLMGLENFNWSFHLRSPAWVLNDAVAALMAEARFGNAGEKRNVVMLTLGTGVGGAILIDGKPYQGAFNKAGHLGHMVINDEGDPGITGMPGSLEECIGNCTMHKRSQGRFDSTLQLLEAYRKGDEWARQVWLKSVRQLAMGLASLANILSPETIVLGGGITEAGADLFTPLQEFMALYEWRPGGYKTEIIKATFGDLAGALGAAAFAMEKSNT